MSRWLSILQFPLVFLPLTVYGLGVFGSDFDVLAGRLFLGLIVALVLLERFAARPLTRLAGTRLEPLLALVGVLLAGAVYRPVHLGYWDEHSTSQALGFCLLGLASWALSRLAAVPRVGGGECRPRDVAGALVLIGLVWGSAWLYPLLPTLGLGAAFALQAGVGGGAAPSAEPSAPRPALGAVGAVLALGLGVDAYLVVWDYQWITAWAPHLLLVFVAAAAAFSVGRRAERLWLAAGLCNFLAAVLFRGWVLHPLHSVLVGSALGGLLAYLLLERRGPCEPRAPATRRGSPLGGFTIYWVLGLALGLGLYQNLAFAGARALLLLLLLALWLKKRRAARA